MVRVKGKTKNTDNGDHGPNLAPSINYTHLLNRVVSFYHKTFCEDGRAMEYLRSRGIIDSAIFSDFPVGYSNGTLLNTIPDEGDLCDALRKIGILNESGHELFYGYVVIPIFDENKDCISLYGRRITEGEAANLYLSGPLLGVFNFQAAKRSKSIILTESIMDLLTLYNAGYKDVLSCDGVHGLTEGQLDLITRSKVKEVYISFGRNDAGNAAAKTVAAKLKEKGIEPYIVQLPEIQLPKNEHKLDINTFFLLTEDAPDIFEKLLYEANPNVSIRLNKIMGHEQQAYEKTDTGLIVQYKDRRYELLGITREGVKLKATIKAAKQKPGDKAPGFHLDTVDLYSNRSRLYFAKSCAVLFSEREEVVTEDITKIMKDIGSLGSNLTC